MKDRHQDPPVGGEEDTRARDALAGDAHERLPDERLVDYLYDELDSDERAEFERAMLADPALEREVEAHQATRGQFARLAAEPMPAGLLDEVLRAADAEAATFAGRAPTKPVAASWWQRTVEGLKGLVFQPAFAMAMVFMLVTGIALYGSRDPDDLPGMGPPRDLQRLPPVAMEPAKSSALEEESPKLEAAARGRFDDDEEAASAELEHAAGVAASIAEGYGGAVDTGAAMRAGANEGAWLADGLREANPAAPGAKPTGGARLSAVGTADGDSTGLSANRAKADAPDSRPGTSYEKPKTLGKAAEAAPKAPAAPVARRGFAEADEMESDRDESAAREEAKERTQQEARSRTFNDSEVAHPVAAPSEVQTGDSASRKAGVDDYAKDVPSAPPMKTETAAPAPAKPAPAPTVEKLWSTLGQQMAAGAWSDAERTLAQLLKAEGDTQRLKAAREALVKAQAAAQTKPADTKPLPEPAKAAPR